MKLKNDKFSLITYNYTKIVEKHTNISNNNIYYTHGNIDSDTVLGIDPSINFNNRKLHLFDKLNQRANVTKGVYSLYDFVSDSNVICYIGLSFDNNDKTTLSTIISTNNKKHIVLYHNKEALKNLIINIQNILGSEEFSKMLNSANIAFVHVDEAFEEK